MSIYKICIQSFWEKNKICISECLKHRDSNSTYRILCAKSYNFPYRNSWSVLNAPLSTQIQTPLTILGHHQVMRWVVEELVYLKNEYMGDRLHTQNSQPIIDFKKLNTDSLVPILCWFCILCIYKWYSAK